MSYSDNFFTNARGPLHRIQFATSPRPLAGAGDPRHVTDPLLAAGWKDHSVLGYPHVLLESPYGVHLILEPATLSPYDAWWQVHPMDGGWHARFGGNTPVEIVAGFTDALIRPSQAGTADMWNVLTSRQWTPYEDRWEQGMASPDGLARVYQRPEHPSWTAEVARAWESGRRDVYWQAHFGQRTPAYLLLGFVTALSDPAPLCRGKGAGVGSSTQTEARLTGKQLVEAHQERLRAAKAAARRLRRATTTALPPPNAPADTIGAARKHNR
ncbi:DUF317 domain-containing protein [Streptomyces phyllanthi]|uniref:DUF317 domain-containing protein n=1 Tax=Streptomyces phyllanthi TaxID=1803180 RepID=A0A5N8WDJ3_9ACTN|nr:DUF317 domain-containing protein [Streptomyces phyllanthi]MPY44498.1 DUF317 domain-containing protein [Streptomyces phyllanthi]